MTAGGKKNFQKKIDVRLDKLIYQNKQDVFLKHFAPEQIKLIKLNIVEGTHRGQNQNSLIFYTVVPPPCEQV